MTATLFAVATPPARSAIAIVRISGPATAATLERLAGSLPPPRRGSLRRLRHHGQEIDQALVLWFPGPASFTGEDSAELHVHGGLAVLEALSVALLALGLSPAEPGAFTRRAVEHGRMDLAQAEGLADLIDAETEAQRRQALEQLGGALGERHERWRALLIDALAYLEAAVDFPDEDLPEKVAERAAWPLRTLLKELDAAISGPPRGEIVRDGFRVALIGEPNVGKSSLLNRLAGREAAIVTAVPGTTRDIIEVPLVLDGYKVLLADTAGLRGTQDAIEAEGVRRAEAWARSAHLRLWIVDRSGTPRPSIVQPTDLVVLSKADLDLGVNTPDGVASVNASAKTASGLDLLRAELRQRLVEATAGADFPAATRSRHVAALSDARDHLARALAVQAPELAAEDVRLAVRALARITGAIGAEEVLGSIFSSFCIGK